MVKVHAFSSVPDVGSSNPQQGIGERRDINLSSHASLVPKPESLLQRKQIGNGETKLPNLSASFKYKYTWISELGWI